MLLTGVVCLIIDTTITLLSQYGNELLSSCVNELVRESTDIS